MSDYCVVSERSWCVVCQLSEAADDSTQHAEQQLSDDADEPEPAGESEILESGSSLQQFFVSSAAADTPLAGASTTGQLMTVDSDLDSSDIIAIGTGDTSSGRHPSNLIADFTALVSPSKVSSN